MSQIDDGKVIEAGIKIAKGVSMCKSFLLEGLNKQPKK